MPPRALVSMSHVVVVVWGMVMDAHTGGGAEEVLRRLPQLHRRAEDLPRDHVPTGERPPEPMIDAALC